MVPDAIALFYSEAATSIGRYRLRYLSDSNGRGLMRDTPAGTIEVAVPDHRPCTRCEGTQHLVGSQSGLGKYRCDSCEMVVGFDLQSDPTEFVLDRGLARRYSKQRWFGPHLAPQEQRLSRSGRTPPSDDAASRHG